VDPNKNFNGTKLDKDFRTKQLIRDALMDNDFLKNLSSGQIREVIDFMQLKKIAAGTYVIREGDSGSHLYVSSAGEYEVIKDGKVLGRLGMGPLVNLPFYTIVKEQLLSKLWPLVKYGRWIVVFSNKL